MVEGSVRNSFMHSFLAKGRLLYTHDRDDCRSVRRGSATSARATRRCSCCAPATSALPPIYKAHKWFVTRGDLDYTALWILYAATPLAQIEVIGRGLLADREVIPQAMTLNPDVLQDGLHRPAQRDEDARRPCRRRCDAIDAYIAERAPTLFAPVIEHLREVGEARSCTRDRRSLQAQLRRRAA